MKSILATAAAGALLVGFAGAASAQMAATATTDLNMRAGPGPQYEVVGVIRNGSSVTIDGCIEGSSWCRVTSDGREAWAFADYLRAEMGGSQVVVSERRAEVPVVRYEGGGQAGAAGGLTTGAVGGAIVGSLIGGPIGAVVGGVAGATAGSATGGVLGTVVDPPREVRTYVTENRVAPVYLEGEVVAGAGVPEVVELRPIPDYQYTYAYVNGVPVLVEPQSRRIVYVIR